MTQMIVDVTPTAQPIIPPNKGGGGFVAGFADGLSQGLRTSMAKKNAMVSTFQSCLTDEGYQLTKQ